MIAKVKAVIRRQAYTALPCGGKSLNSFRDCPIGFDGIHFNNPIRLCVRGNLLLRH